MKNILLKWAIIGAITVCINMFHFNLVYANPVNDDYVINGDIEVNGDQSGSGIGNISATGGISVDGALESQGGYLNKNNFQWNSGEIEFTGIINQVRYIKIGANDFKGTIDITVVGAFSNNRNMSNQKAIKKGQTDDIILDAE